MKTGRLSAEEWEYIEKFADTKSPELIAVELDRRLEPVQKYLKKIGKFENQKQALIVQAEYDIKSRPYWKEVCRQFDEDELELFLYHWSQIIAQFKKDVLATEELQIVDTVKLEILMNRALREQQQSMERVRLLDEDLRTERSRDPDQQDRELIYNIERQIASLMAAKESLSREFKDLQKKKADMFKDLKATREQRIQKLENSKSTMAELIERILRDPQFFTEQGKELEKMRLAMENEKKRLGDYHKYEDGMVDVPLLTPETVMEIEDKK